MRGFVIAGLAVVLMLGFSGGADARGGRGGFGFARTGPAAGAHAKPAPKPRGTVLFVSTGGMRSGAAASPAAASPAAPPHREALPVTATAVTQPRVEAEAPRRPWCEDGKVLGGLCVLN